MQFPLTKTSPQDAESIPPKIFKIVVFPAPLAPRITHNSLIAPMADKVIHVKNGTIDNIEINTNKIPVEEIEW